MKITLTQDEIAQAVRDYVGRGVTLSNGNQMAVDFSMGRGENGLSATIDVPYMGVSSLPVTPATAPANAPAPAPVPKTTVATPKVTTQAEAPATVDATDAHVDTGTSAPPFATGEQEASEEVAAPATSPGKSLFGTPAA